MTTGMFLTLVRARYRLQWARARGTPGGRFLYVLMHVVLVVVATVSVVAGLGMAAAGTMLGRGAAAAGVMLTGFFLNALVASVVLGFGLTQVFSDAALRRYPLSTRARLVARHGLGLLEPLWVVTMMLYLGTAIGFAVAGPGLLVLALPAAAVLAATNYLLTRAIIAGVERASATSAGQLILFVIFQTLFLAPAALRLLVKSIEVGPLMEDMVRATPPRAAAMILSGSFGIRDVAALLGWLAASAGALALADARPERVQAATRASTRGGGVIDWVARRLPGVSPPLAARTLRYYLRNPHLRGQLIVLLPLMTYLGWRFSSDDPRSTFAAAMALGAMAGGFLTLQMDANVFGYDGSGLKRLLLGPTRPSQVLRAVSVAPLVIPALYVALIVAVWVAISPIPVDLRMVVMVLSSGLAGMFVLRAMAVWASIVAPRKMNYQERFKNQLTWAGNIVALLAFVGLGVLGAALGFAGSRGELPLGYWWIAPLVTATAAAVYAASLRGAESAFAERREWILTRMEGKA